MLRLIGIVISIGLADSLNPTTIGPALYFATRHRGRGQVVEFALAVFAVNFIGGAAIAVGGGELIRSLIPHPRHDLAYLVEIAAGVAMIAAGALLWRHRHRLAHREPPAFDPHGRSSWVLGASITAVELPTAFPYFAAIAAIVGSGPGPVRAITLIVLFNLCFVLPLLVIVATLTLAPERADQLLATGRSFLHRRWPTLLAAVAVIAGLFVVLLGATGIAAGHSGFIRNLRHTLHGLK